MCYAVSYAENETDYAPEFDALGADRDAVNPERMGPVNSDGVMEILANADN
jgi:hypothetical protein